jgi:hypothetical protein
MKKISINTNVYRTASNTRRFESVSTSCSVHEASHVVPLVPYMKPVMYKDATSSHVHILICPMFFFIVNFFSCHEYMLEKIEGAIKNEQSRDTEYIEYKAQNEDKH